ncbi:wax ester/triacylglycerol synthase domain-containing protein [Nonomuraea sp. NPDC050404]|uniref:wax ester/triacylglycerol synthase domain-containing protein n=1 Tax=Nonomuraea sp. NPDC050404 TaxID=3155783 RepID=UPI0033FA286D
MNNEFLPGAVPLTFGDRYVIRLGAGAVCDSRMHNGIAVRRPGPAPELASLCRLVGEAVRVRAPALAYRPAGGPLRRRWEPDPAFDPAHHVEFHPLPAGVCVHQAVMDAMRVRPLSRDRPLWSLMVLRRADGGEHVLCYRAHHAFQDGMGTIGAAHVLLGAGTLPAPGAEGAYRKPPGWRRQALADLRRLATPQPRWFDVRDGGSPDLRLQVIALDRAPFDDIARASGATIAQIGLTVVTGALRSWNPPAWPTLTGDSRTGDSRISDTLTGGSRELVVALPVGLRGQRQHTGMGNHTALLPITLPCDEPATLARLGRVAEQTTLQRLAQARRAGRELYSLAPGVAAPLLRLLSPLFRKGSPRRLSVTAVPLPKVFAAPGEVFAVPGLVPGLAGMVVILPGEETVSFSGVFDPRVARSEDLLGLLEQELKELHAQATR